MYVLTHSSNGWIRISHFSPAILQTEEKKEEIFREMELFLFLNDMNSVREPQERWKGKKERRRNSRRKGQSRKEKMEKGRSKRRGGFHVYCVVVLLPWCSKLVIVLLTTYCLRELLFQKLCVFVVYKFVLHGSNFLPNR